MKTIHEKIIQTIKSKETVDDVIAYLRTLSFSFITELSWQNKITPKKVRKLPPKFMEYQAMAFHLDKETKFDGEFLCLIKIVSPRKKQIGFLIDGELVDTHLVPWKSTNINYKGKQVQRYFFPVDMHYDLRRNWKNEHERYEKRPEMPKSEFYLSWKDKILIK